MDTAKRSGQKTEAQMAVKTGTGAGQEQIEELTWTKTRGGGEGCEGRIICGTEGVRQL